MKIDEALKWADTFGPIRSDPPDGNSPALLTLAAEVRRLQPRANVLPELVEAMRKFCDRVECGEVRSRKTYAEFKNLLARAETVLTDGK